MNKFTTVLATVAAIFLFGIGGVVSAQQAVNPGGPWVTPAQDELGHVSLEAFMTYEELSQTLTRIETNSQGRVRIDTIATSAAGREVWAAEIGDPANPAVMVINQQHGDEPHGAEAAVDIIKSLGNGSARSNAILKELFVVIVPRMNVDGPSFPDRGNGDLTAPVRNSRSCFDDMGEVDPEVTNRERGVFTDRFVNDSSLWHYDMNRYHWADWSQSWQIRCNPGLLGTSVHFNPGTSPVPEAAGAVRAYDIHQPIWVIDVHNQGPSVVDEDERPENGAFRPNRLVTGSILWPVNEDVAEVAVDLSKQMALIMKRRSIELGYAEISRFSGGDFPGIARNAYGLFGTTRLDAGETGPLGGSVLLEVLGQTEGSINFNLGQKSIGKLRNLARELVMSVIEATADGSLFVENPDDVDELILTNDPNISNPLPDNVPNDEEGEEDNSPEEN
jgi:hypothetical protein